MASESKTASGERRFTVRRGVLHQRSQLDPTVVWAVPQVADSIDPANANLQYFEGQEEGRKRPVYNEKARWAKTVQKDGKYFLARREIPVAELREKLEAIFEGRDTKEIFLRADKDAPYGVVVKALAAAREAGASQLGMVTEPE